MAYQSAIQRTKSISAPSQSGSMWGTALGALGGALLALPTGGMSVGAGASLGAGIGGALGGTVFSDSQEVPVGGGSAYGATSMAQAMQPPQVLVQPLPGEDPRAFHARLSDVFRDKERRESQAFHG